MKVYDWDPRKLQPEWLAAIGLVVASSAQNEQFVEDAIAGCAGLDALNGKIVTAHLSMPQRFDILRSLANTHLADNGIATALNEHVKKLEQGFTRRNEIVHRKWCRDSKTNEYFTLRERARSKLEVELIPMSLEKVRRDGEFIYLVGIEFFEFLGLMGLHPGLPKRAISRAKR